MAVTKLPGQQISLIDATNLATDAVESAAIKAGAVVAGKLANASIDNASLFAASVVDANALADNAVDSAAIAAGAVVAGKLGNNAVASANIAANAVTAAKLNNDVAGGGLVLDGSTNALNVNLGQDSGLQISTDALSLLFDGNTLQKGGNGVSVNQSASFNFTNFTGQLSSALSANSFKITSLATPTTGTDAANKNYVDSIASGLDVKQSCLVATTGALPAFTYNPGSSGLGATITGNANGAIGTIDGVPIAATGIRILVKNETAGNAPYNGIYVVTALGDSSNPYVLTRAADFNSNVNITPGAFTFIESGTVQADTGWVLATDGAITVGSTGLIFNQFSQTAAVNAGNGLTKVGNTISALLWAGATGNFAPAIDISSNGLAIKIDNSSIGVDGNNQLQVKANGITSGMIANGAVGTNQLANNAVVTSKISDGNVTAAKLNSDVTSQLGALGTMATATITTGTETINLPNSATAADKDSALLVFLNGALLTPGAGAGTDYTRNVTNNRTTGFTLKRSGVSGGCTYFFGG